MSGIAETVVAPRFAWCGDDFTGASDTLATLARGGMRALLFLDVPTPAQRAAAGPLDAIGLATAARALAPDAMRAALAPAAAFLAACGAPVLHYKVCSTFDSAPQVGSIGEAVRTLHRPAYASWVPVIGGQPSLGRWCVFGQLFAEAGAGGAVHRIDRHPTMSRHPVTPMDEADLALHLSRQGLAPRGSIDWRALEGPADALDARLRAILADAPDPHAPCAVLFDATNDVHLAAIGALVARHARQAPVLAVGASSVAQAMLAHWSAERGPAGHGPRTPDAARAAAGPIGAAPPGGDAAHHALSATSATPATPATAAPVAPAAGPVFVLAGSLSPRSAEQVAAARAYMRVPLDPARLCDGDAGYLARTVDAIAGTLAGGLHVLATTAPAAGAPARAEPRLAPACGALLAAVARRVRCARIGVVGGDTSSHAMQALAPWGIGWVGTMGAGGELLRARADDPALDGLELMLKGGQMGRLDILDQLVRGAGAGAGTGTGTGAGTGTADPGR
jgi:uncharacterized protein YgbK (DUF1537 family)